MFNSTEYSQRNRTDREYIHDLYWSYLQRSADEEGYQFWLAILQQYGRVAVADAFADSPEYAQHVSDLCQTAVPTEAVQWQLTDHTGSVRAILNESGSVLGRHDYLPFGDSAIAGRQQQNAAQAESSSTGFFNWETTQLQRYGEMESDPSTALRHTEWRKYDDWQGRWTSVDPAHSSMSVGDPQSLNRYAYVQNDPVNFVDPSGLDNTTFLHDSGHIGPSIHEYVSVSVSWDDWAWDRFFGSWGGGYGIPQPIGGGGGDIGGGGGDPGAGGDALNHGRPPQATYDRNRFNECLNKLYGVQIDTFNTGEYPADGKAISIFRQNKTNGLIVITTDFVSRTTRQLNGGAGGTFPDNPSYNYVARDYASTVSVITVLATQIHEIGNSLGEITGRRPRALNRAIRRADPDTGQRLEECVFGGVVLPDGTVTKRPPKK